MSSRNFVFETYFLYFLFRLWECRLTGSSCYYLLSALKLNPSHLRELDMSYNYLKDYDVTRLIGLQENPNYRLETFRWESPMRKWAYRRTSLCIEMLWLRPYHWEDKLKDWEGVQMIFSTAEWLLHFQKHHPVSFELCVPLLDLTEHHHWIWTASAFL